MHLQFEKMEKYFVALKNQYFDVCIYEENLFEQNFKDSNVNLFYFAPSYSPVEGKWFLQSL